jgi:dipeptidyl aminopeptidase/acylaminoacyl peptidase
MRPRLTRLIAAALFLSFAQTSAFADKHSQAKPTLEELMAAAGQVCNYGDVSIAPDGRYVAWTQTIPDKRTSATLKSGICVATVPSNGRAPAPLRAGLQGHGLQWSPDGKQLAYLADAGKGQSQIYVIDVAGSEPPRKLTNLTGFLSHLRWSPDGRRIAFLFIENARRTPGPVQPGIRDVGLIEERVDEQRLCAVDLDDSRVRKLSPADTYVYEYDWSPDSHRLAVIAAHGSGDNNWYIAELYTLALGSGKMKSIHKPPLQIAVPRWSHDGKSIAFIGGLMSDEGSTGGDIFSVPAGGGPARNLTPGAKASASWLSWLPEGDVLFAEHVDGGVGIGRIDLQSGRVADVWTGDCSIAAGGGFPLSVDRDGKTSAFVRQSFQQPPEIWAGRTGSWRPVTHLNRDLRPFWGKSESLHWKSDQFNIQGWLLYPHDYDPNRRYPMIVSIHGGPAASRKPSWSRGGLDMSLFSADDCFVFYPNPRGSFGQGETFTRANVKDFGYGDLRDIMAGVDHVLKTLPVDKDRLGVMGGSYGGYMTMWTVTQTHRFRAGVAIAGIANWQSYYGENGIDQWMIPYFGASVYDDPAVYARSAPITFIKNVKTPTLIMVGERDRECPPPQSFEFWHALKTFGVPTELVVYENEGHGFGQPEHRRDAMKRSIAWFHKYLLETADGQASTSAGR